jgi:hypothetical protein
MLPRSCAHFIPAGKAPHRGADAVKASYLKYILLVAAPNRQPKRPVQRTNALHFTCV